MTWQNFWMHFFTLLFKEKNRGCGRDRDNVRAIVEAAGNG